MNLVDAIRKAAQQSQGVQGESATTAPRAPASAPANASDAPQHEPEAMQTVRFEVRLTNQQLYDLLSWLARALHPVMTLREAAHYLRLRIAELEALAEQGAIPAFKVDGRWRFLKNALDEWMLLQKASDLETHLEEKEESHAA